LETVAIPETMVVPATNGAAMTPTRVRVEIADDADGEEARSLGRWLARDTTIGPRSGVATVTADDTDDMGDVLDLITLVVTSAIGLSSLVVSIASWRDSRPRGRRTRLHLDGGAVVEVGDDEEETIQALADAVGVLRGTDR
jgi:hypothetical protein